MNKSVILELLPQTDTNWQQEIKLTMESSFEYLLRDHKAGDFRRSSIFLLVSDFISPYYFFDSIENCYFFR